MRGLSRQSQKLLAASVLLALVGGAIWSYATGGIVSILLQRGPNADERLDLVKDYFESYGIFSPLVYVAMVTVEVVVAPIPGLMLYAPGGIIFGGFWGGLLSLIGNVLGAGISCQLMRILGRDRLERLLRGQKMSQYDKRLSKAGIWVVFALRVNPFTSSDLVSYAAGLTGIATIKVMLGTMLGMAPLCWAQAYLAESVIQSFPLLIYPLIFLCLLYFAIVIWVVRKLLRDAPAAP